MIALIILAVICLGTYIIYKSWCGYRLAYECGHPKRAEEFRDKDIPFKTERFSFSSADGLVLRAIQYIPAQQSKGTILACHYLGGTKKSIYSYVEPLIENGFTVVAFDYPNHGQSDDRKNNRFTLEDDMNRFIQQVKKLGIPGPYGTIGFSMGATIAISAVDKLPELKAIFVDSGPLLLVKEYFRYVLENKKVTNIITRTAFLFFYLYVVGFQRMSRRMMKRLKNMRDVPILFIHSRTDRIITYKNIEKIKKIMTNNPIQIVTVEKAHHLTNKILMGKKYDDLMIQFFMKWMVTNETTNDLPCSGATATK